MFKLNTIQKTKSGENLMPFVVDGDVVSCFTKNKEVVYRNLKDFDFSSPPRKKEVIMVQSREDINTDIIFTVEPIVNEITEPEVNEPKTITEPAPVKSTLVVEPKVVEPTPVEPTPVVMPKPVEPTPVVVPKPDPISTGSIWDDLDDEYV